MHGMKAEYGRDRIRTGHSPPQHAFSATAAAMACASLAQAAPRTQRMRAMGRGGSAFLGDVASIQQAVGEEDSVDG
jgi:hypothetical protein